MTILIEKGGPGLDVDVAGSRLCSCHFGHRNTGLELGGKAEDFVLD